MRRGSTTGRPGSRYLIARRLERIGRRATGSGWALYLGGFRIPKYWQYRRRDLLQESTTRSSSTDHAGEPLRFSADNGIEFVETGLTLSRPEAARADRLPTQREVLLG